MRLFSELEVTPLVVRSIFFLFLVRDELADPPFSAEQLPRHTSPSPTATTNRILWPPSRSS